MAVGVSVSPLEGLCSRGRYRPSLTLRPGLRRSDFLALLRTKERRRGESGAEKNEAEHSGYEIDSGHSV